MAGNGGLPSRPGSRPCFRLKVALLITEWHRPCARRKEAGERRAPEYKKRKSLLIPGVVKIKELPSRPHKEVSNCSGTERRRQEGRSKSEVVGGQYNSGIEKNG